MNVVLDKRDKAAVSNPLCFDHIILTKKKRFFFFLLTMVGFSKDKGNMLKND